MVYPGQIAYLSCKLATEDQVEVQWLKDEQPLVLDESRMSVMPSGALEIDEVLPQDVGSYRCNATGFGQYRLSNKAQLTLQSTDLGELCCGKKFHKFFDDLVNIFFLFESKLSRYREKIF